ncbi:MAG: mechanosensitive ion channel [Elusimicrobia bacterium]|nr:mechanosensitive ion channel [Elusimicrobiota bacterium]
MRRMTRVAACCSLALLLASQGAPMAAAGQVVAAARTGAVPTTAGSFKVGPLPVGGPGYAGVLSPLSAGTLTSLPSPAPGIRQGAAPLSPGLASVLPVAWGATTEAPPRAAPQAGGVAAPFAREVGESVSAPVRGEAQVASAGALLGEVRTILSHDADGRDAVQAPLESKGRWDDYWSRTKAMSPADAVPAAPVDLPAVNLAASQQVDQGQPVSPPAPPAAQAPASGSKKPGKSLVLPLVLGGLYAAARLGLPAWLPAFWVKAAPFVASAGIFAATSVVNRLLRAGVEAAARRAHWQAGTVVVVRLGVGAAVWVVGGALALHAAGVTTAALLTTFGVGGVAMTMAAKEFIGNFLEGLKILVTKPYVIGDRIKVGTTEYTVKDMNLRYVELARVDGGTTMMTYVQLSEKAVTVFREYAARKAATARANRRLWSDVYRLVRENPRLTILASSLWTVLGVGLVVALPFMPGLLPLQAVAAWIPYLQGAVTLLAARSLDKGVTGFIRRLAEKRGWDPQGTVVLKLAVQVAVYAIGGTAALRFFGMTWSALLASLGATSIAVGWASADILGNLIQGFWILMNHPFTIGDAIEAGGVTGTVVDMNLNYVVLEHPDKSHSLVPYAVIKSSPFTVLKSLASPAGR